MEYNLNTKKKLLNFLMNFITENKSQKFEQIIQYRTRYMTVVLEDIFQSQNASAVLRTCDCFGIQDIHIIENENKYKINPGVALGASKWINIIKYSDKENNTENCLKALKKQGYKIVATTPHKGDYTLDKLKINKKTALLFGTELEGLSEAAMNNADEFVKIPMYGFTESFNISVSAAICLFHLTEKLRKSRIKWRLTNEEIIDIKIRWAKSVIKKAELLEKDFIKRYN